MNIIDIIEKKRKGEELTLEELDFSFNGFLKSEIPDYQMSSLLMAITINGMTNEETINLTDIFLKSGDILDLSSINDVIVDKHSTGGVGDKTTFIVAPVLASCGVNICKLSGRGLGITGGTIDKLESIKGIRCDLSEEEIVKELKDINMVVTAATPNLTPMDSKVYSLRDATGTVSSIPLIASSIMSKKIAGNSDKIFIDLKVGSGALLKTLPEAECLGELLQEIGKHYDKEVYVELSNMNEPLGSSVGNAIEILEAMDILQGKEKNNLTRLCTRLIVRILMSVKGISQEEAGKEAADAFSSGKAYRKFLEFVKYQEGDINSLRVSNKRRIIKSKEKGLIKNIDALKIGEIVRDMGGGRLSKEDKIDHSVGIYFFKHSGDYVNEGDDLCTLFLGDKDVEDDKVLSAYRISDEGGSN